MRGTVLAIDEAEAPLRGFRGRSQAWQKSKDRPMSGNNRLQKSLLSTLLLLSGIAHAEVTKADLSVEISKAYIGIDDCETAIKAQTRLTGTFKGNAADSYTLILSYSEGEDACKAEDLTPCLTEEEESKETVGARIEETGCYCLNFVEGKTDIQVDFTPEFLQKTCASSSDTLYFHLTYFEDSSEDDELIISDETVSENTTLVLDFDPPAAPENPPHPVSADRRLKIDFDEASETDILYYEICWAPANSDGSTGNFLDGSCKQISAESDHSVETGTLEEGQNYDTAYRAIDRAENKGAFSEPARVTVKAFQGFPENYAAILDSSNKKGGGEKGGCQSTPSPASWLVLLILAPVIRRRSRLSGEEVR